VRQIHGCRQSGEFLKKAAQLMFAAIFCALLAGCSTQTDDRGATPAPMPPAPPAAADLRPVIAALGDSLTAGLGVDPANNYPSRLQSLVDTERLQFRVVNAGVSGDTSAQGLNRLAAVRALNPKIVIVELGANDGLRGIPLTQTRSNLEEILQTLKSDGVQAILAGMQIPPNYGPEYTGEFRTMYSDLASKHRVPLVPFFLDGVAGRPELNQEDGMHPTSEGYQRVTENVWKIVRPLLK
jgi:acyl-CoA thioesterase I